MLLTRSHIQSIYVNPFSVSSSLQQKVFFILRLGMLGCFAGHGFWGLNGKAGWLVFFELFGISADTAGHLMPLIGLMDILVGVLAFLVPSRALLLYALLWTIFTAALRPSAGMGMSEFVERAGNYGLPLSMLFIAGSLKPNENWFSPIRISKSPGPVMLKRLELILRASLFLLLAGHAGLAIFVNHPNLLKHISTLGLSPDIQTLRIFGILEMTLACIVLIKPRIPGLMFFVLFFKLFCESMYPISGPARDVFETIERFGDYTIPLALWVLYRHHSS